MVGFDMISHGVPGVVLLCCGLVAQLPATGDWSQFTALGILAVFFLVVLPRIEAAREKRRAEELKAEREQHAAEKDELFKMIQDLQKRNGEKK